MDHDGRPDRYERWTARAAVWRAEHPVLVARWRAAWCVASWAALVLGLAALVLVPSTRRGLVVVVTVQWVLLQLWLLCRTKTVRWVSYARALRATKGLTDRDGLSPSERAGVARQVGIGAVKYADLSYARDRDYVFNWDTMLALEGNTGPYLQYAVARINSLIDRSGEHAGTIANGEIVIGHDAERALVIHALGFGGEVHAVAETLEPHRLCGYLYELATRFTAFYENCPVLRAPDDRTRRSRLALSLLAARTLTRGLGLLGIEVPRRM